MKTGFILIISLALTSCVSKEEPYVQDNVKIYPPVTQKRDADGNRIQTSFNDGGTQKITITDVKGTTHDIYIDFRIGTNSESIGNGLVYLDTYPGDKGSMPVSKQNEFRSKIIEKMK